MDKTAIVLGATGLVGRTLVDQLASAKHIETVITLTRRSAAHPSPKVFNHVVDFNQLEKYVSLFQGDFLFSCLGTTLRQAGSIEAQRQVDVDYQFQAARIAASNGVTHYLLVSSSGANASSNNAYLKMKGELEQQVQSLPFSRISIFQPSLLLGQRTESRFGETIGSLLLPILCLIPGLRRFRPIKAEQVAAKLVHVSDKKGQGIEWFKLDELFAIEGR
jgi:uncharacterized protein YbjT (DUF2867 family)